MLITIVFWFGCDRPSVLLFFLCPLCFFPHSPLFLSSSSVSLSYFILAVPMRECLGKHSCMSSPFPIAILNGTFFFRSVKAMNNWKRSAIKQILLLLDAYQVRSTQSRRKAVPWSWTAIDIRIPTLLVHERSPPSNYCMGTTGCRISHPNLTNKAMEMRTLARVNTKYSPLVTARITLHLCTDRAMENMELVQNCTEPARLCEYRLVQECSTEHSRQRTGNKVPLKAH